MRLPRVSVLLRIVEHGCLALVSMAIQRALAWRYEAQVYVQFILFYIPASARVACGNTPRVHAVLLPLHVLHVLDGPGLVLDGPGIVF